MNDLQTIYPPEKETDFSKKYKGKNEAEVGWRTVQADATGYVRLDSLVQPNEQALVYGLVYVLSHLSLTLSSRYCINGAIKYSISRRSPVFTSALTATPGISRTVLPSMLIVPMGSVSIIKPP